MKKQILDNEYIYIEYDNGIMIGYYKSGLKIDLLAAKKVVSSRLEFFNGKKYPLLVEDKGVISMSKEARDFLSTEEGSAGITAGALVLNSVFSTFLGNFFLKVAKPKIPARIFKERNSAIEWLKQYKVGDN